MPQNAKSTLVGLIQIDDNENNNIEVHCYSKWRDIEPLFSRWRNLEKRSIEPFTYFQSSQWCINWLKHFKDLQINGQAIVPRIYTLEQSGKINLLWPLMETRSKFRTWNLTVLSDPLSQYSNMLVDEKHVSHELGKQFVQKIISTNQSHALGLTHFPAGSFMAKILADHGYLADDDDESKILDLTQFDNWDSYHSQLPKSQRKERNRRRNKLQKMGELSYQVLSSDHEQFESLVLEALDLKNIWLESVGKKNLTLSKRETRNFLSQYSKFSDTASTDRETKTRSEAVIHVLSIDKKNIAMELGYIHNQDYYSFLGAINLDWAKYSPGKVQIEFAQKWAKENGIEKFDFLNDPSSYKVNWTNASEPLQNRYIPISKRGIAYTKLWKLGVRPKLLEMYQNSNLLSNKLIKHILNSN